MTPIKKHTNTWKAVFILALIPLLIRIFAVLIPYWYSSRVDRADSFFLLGGIILAVTLFCRYQQTATSKTDLTAIPFLLGSLCAYGYGHYISLNALIYLGAVAVAANALWLLWGWKLFWKFVPACLMTALALQTTALANLIPGYNILLFKTGAAVFLAFYVLVTESIHFVPRFRDAFYYSCVILVLATGFMMRKTDQRGAFLRLDVNKNFSSDRKYIAEDIPLDEFDRKFFSESRNVSKRTFFRNNGSYITLLEVTSGKSVNNIHQSAVCFSTGGWDVISTEKRLITLKDGRKLAIEELELQQGANPRFLLYTWYAGKNFSTGGFIDFRRSFSPDDTWYIYQIMTPFGFSKTETRNELENFISHIMIPETDTDMQENIKRK